MDYVLGTIGGLLLLGLGLTAICASVWGAKREARRKALERLARLEERDYVPQMAHTEPTYLGGLRMPEQAAQAMDALANVRDGLRPDCKGGVER